MKSAEFNGYQATIGPEMFPDESGLVKREELLEAHSMPRVCCELDGQGIMKVPTVEEVSIGVQNSRDMRNITADSRRD